MMETEHRVSVVLASANRPTLLADVLEDVLQQTYKPIQIVVSVPDEASLPNRDLPPGTLIANARGLAAQRNAGLMMVPDATHVFFFDDDAVVREDYVENAIQYFDRHRDIVALTGRVLIDGATTSEVDRAAARAALSRSLSEPRPSEWTGTRELYGCNFAYRTEALRGELFDERLPLYSWLEDHDFARRAMRRGIVAKVSDCVIVHRGAKSGGRTAHKRLGYSQVVNPVHLWRKGSFPFWLMLHETLPRVLKNAARSAAGSERSWRRTRLHGNLLAIAHIASGRLTPEFAARIPSD